MGYGFATILISFLLGGLLYQHPSSASEGLSKYVVGKSNESCELAKKDCRVNLRKALPVELIQKSCHKQDRIAQMLAVQYSAPVLKEVDGRDVPIEGECRASERFTYKFFKVKCRQSWTCIHYGGTSVY